MRFLLQENESDFKKAWGLQTARKLGRNLPKTCLDPRVLFYSEVASFGAQVGRLFKLAGRDQTLVIVFDDFADDTLGVYRQILKFLDVEYDGQTEFERRFESQMYRYRWLQRLLFVPATSEGKFIETLQQRSRKYERDGSRKESLIKRVTKINKVDASPPPLNPQMKEILCEILRPDIMRLSRLLDRDLSHWIS